MTKKDQLIQTLSKIQEVFDEKDKLFDEFMEIAPEGIMILDIESATFVKCNTNAVKVLKYSKKVLLSKGPEFFSPEFQPNGRRSSEMILEYIERIVNGEKIVMEWQVVNGKGVKFITEVRLVLLTHTLKQQIYASFVDITERKKAEEIISNQNKRLYEIASMQSHQVRQPIANILGLINLFNFHDINDPMNAELILRIVGTTQRFDQIIKEITEKTHQIKNEIDDVRSV